jgi:carbamoyltransferase
MTSSRAVLGIHDGHNSGASLVIDGAIVASVSEERISRRKNEVGYPEASIEACLRIGGIDRTDLDDVVFASNFMHRPEYLLELAPWYKVGLGDQRKDAEKSTDYQKVLFDVRRQERITTAGEQLDFDPARVRFLEHHLAHLTAAYYTSPYLRSGEPVLGLTCDGAGDGLSATVSECRGTTFERIAATSRDHSLGKIYSRMTMMMGMTPWEHEYKLMGLAPYADPARADKAAERLRDILGLSEDGLSFQSRTELTMNYVYEYLRDAFEGVRFDSAAAAVQLFTEEMLVQWVRNAVAQTGMRNIVCGGGVFMNVKANMLIAALPEVESMWVMPSAGDESLSIGAALHVFHEEAGSTDFGSSRLGNLYLGPDLTADDLAEAERQALALGYTVEHPDNPDAAAAALIASGEVIAVCRGRMEWGARALGNRSIVADPSHFSVVDRINSMIKVRDFWMPFAPSIRAEDAPDYIDGLDRTSPWFMTHAYPVREGRRDEIIAGSHPRDRTIRPQVVTREANPRYHALISEFKALTGRGAVLNTSFNIHGEPIVMTAVEAVDVMRRSGLQNLLLGDMLVRKSN